MYIKSIYLENYRNYKNINIDFHRNVNVILGDNGQGKTNLLESIYLTSMGKSFKSIKDKELIKFGEEFFRVKALYNREEDDGKIDIYISEKGLKAIKIDDVNISRLSEMLDNVITVIFSPEDLQIVKSDPSNRRNFMDREISQLYPSYFSDIYDYRKIINNKNSLLKEKNINHDMIDVYNSMLSEISARIMIKRVGFIENINKISGSIHNNITNGKEELFIEYNPDIEIDDILENVDISKIDFIENNDILIKIRDRIEKVLKDNKDNDIFRRSSTRGCQRDDFSVFINGINTRKFGSQGQQRTASLSLKLAEIDLIKREKEINPILLLDDVMSELDYERQSFLVNSIKDVQIFLTTTDINKEVMNRFPQGKIIYIKNGEILEEKES